jgi:hypothetical protein
MNGGARVGDEHEQVEAELRRAKSKNYLLHCQVTTTEHL